MGPAALPLSAGSVQQNHSLRLHELWENVTVLLLRSGDWMKECDARLVIIEPYCFSDMIGNHATD